MPTKILHLTDFSRRIEIGASLTKERPDDYSGATGTTKRHITSHDCIKRASPILRRGVLFGSLATGILLGLDALFPLHLLSFTLQSQRPKATRFIPLAPKDNGRALKQLIEKRMAGYQMSVNTGIRDLTGMPRTQTRAIYDAHPEAIGAMSVVANTVLKAYHTSRSMNEAKDKILEEINLTLSQEHGIWIEADIVGLFIPAQQERIPLRSPENIVIDFAIFQFRGHFAVPTDSGREFRVGYIRPLEGEKARQVLADYTKPKAGETRRRAGGSATPHDNIQILSQDRIKHLLIQTGQDASEGQILNLARALANQEVQRQLLLEAGLTSQTRQHETLIWLAALIGETKSAILALEVLVYSSKGAGSDVMVPQLILEQLTSQHRLAATQPHLVLAHYQQYPKELRANAIEMRVDTISQLRDSGFSGKVDFVVDEGEE